MEQVLKVSEASFRAIVAKNGEGVIVVARDGLVRYVNPAGEALINRSAEELLDQPFDFPVDAVSEIEIHRGNGEIALTEMRAIETTWLGLPAHLFVLRDVTQERRIRERLELLDRLVENAQHDMMFVLDCTGAVIQSNALANTALGCERDRMLGRNIEALFRPESGVVWRQIAHALETAAQWRGRVSAVCRGGREFPAEMTLSRYRDRESQCAGTICLVRDMTEEKEMERAKSDFISTASHELRTPMTSIKNAVDLVLRKKAGEINGQQKRFLHIAEQNIDRLSALVDDLLDLTKIEAGKMQLCYSEVDVRSCVADVVAMFKLVAQAKSVTLDMHLPPELPVVHADEHRVQEVLINLLDNAVKFTPPGGTVTAEVRPLALPADAAGCSAEAVEIAVIDSGEGIGQDKVAHVFDKFYQVRESPVPGKRGTGLGLAISKAIVEAHGGVIACRSRPGRGSTFAFTLPAGRQVAETV